MSTIGIIIPFYNTEKYLNRCIDSIMSQTRDDFEIILVDDGSADEGGCICERYAREYSNVTVIHQKNRGQASARNIGLDYATDYSKGKWVTFIDSDDWVASGYLENLYRLVEEYGVCVSVCGYLKATDSTDNLFPEDERNYSLMETEDLYCEKNLLTVVPWGKLYDKACFDGIRFPVGKICEDEFTIYKAMFRTSEVAYTVSPLYYYFCNSNSVTQSNSNIMRLDGFDAMMECSDYLKKNNYQKAYLFSLKKAVFFLCEVHNNNVDALLANPDKLKYLRRVLRKLLRLSRKEKLFGFSKYRFVYEIAHPLLMKYYWFFHSMTSKVRKRK